MLKLMRDSFNQLKWILIAIVAAFVFGFVFLDMGLGGALRGKTEGTYAARVNGETISYNDYYRSLKSYEDMYRQMYGGQFTPEMSAAMRLPAQVIDSLIEQRLLGQEARRLSLSATPEEVRTKLLSLPVFVLPLFAWLLWSGAPALERTAFIWLKAGFSAVEAAIVTPLIVLAVLLDVARAEAKP